MSRRTAGPIGTLFSPLSLRNFGLTANVKGTPAARRGRKATALDHYRTRGPGRLKGKSICVASANGWTIFLLREVCVMGRPTAQGARPACQR